MVLNGGGIWSNQTAHHVYVYRNKIHDIGRWPGCPSYMYGRPGIFQGIGTTNHTYDSNVFYDIGRFPEGPYDGACEIHFYQHDHGIYAFGDNNVVINNIFYNMNAGWGISVDGPNFKIVNNTFYGTQPDTQPNRGGHILLTFDEPGRDAENLIIENNISYAPKLCFLWVYNSGHQMTTAVIIKNNLVYGNVNLISWYPFDNPPQYTESANIVGSDSSYDPKFVDIANRNFRLQSNSPAINGGLQHSIRIYDADGNPIVGAPDIGAYEYVSGEDDTIPPSAPSGLTVQ